MLIRFPDNEYGRQAAYYWHEGWGWMDAGDRRQARRSFMLYQYYLTLAKMPQTVTAINRRVYRQVDLAIISRSPSGRVVIHRYPSERQQRSRPPSGLSVVKTRTGERQARLSAVARDRIVSAVNILESLVGRDGLRFWTGTLPTTDEALLRIVEGSVAYITHRLRLYMGRVLRRAGNCPHIVLVWEWQRRGALHVHAVFHGEGIPYGVWEDIWKRVISSLPGWRDQEGLRWDVACRLERIRKSVGRYVAKYMSKGGSAGGRSIAGRLWSIGRELVRMIREATCRVLAVVDFDTLVRGLPRRRIFMYHGVILSVVCYWSSETETALRWAMADPLQVSLLGGNYAVTPNSHATGVVPSC